MGYLPGFVVAPDQGDTVRVPHFQSQQQKKSFHRIEPTVNIVPQKQIVRSRALSTLLEQLQQVIELPMNVPTNGDRQVNPLHIILFDQNLPGPQAQRLDLVLVEVLASL